ncbi:MAG: aspartate aminotransferase family protein, partial [Bacteroidales bacterium]|nr:aspartate aminotransferase family protein [Bacteroidales bacterium]
MNLFDVYPLWDIEPAKGLGCKLWDKNGKEYLDLYGGHAVISIGHSHPTYVKMISEQVGQLGFYSNSVQNSLQKEFAKELGEICGYPDYALFLCNSGAEANENALKVASFHTGKAKVLAFRKAFHGRTSGAVAATDNPKIQAPFNETANIVFVPLNDLEAVDTELSRGGFAAVIIEGIQGVAGIHEPTVEFINGLRALCDKYGCLLILDEIQSGYGRTGKFFAHQHYGVRADIVTMAKGMGNGFPIGGVLINPTIKPSYGML